MKITQNKKVRSRALLLIFLVWLVYSMSYLGKVNYSANITQIVDFYNITKAEAGLAPTFFFFAYGIGQVFNGFFSKSYNVKWMVFSSLFISATINITIAITTNFVIIKWLWLINGFILSILWPSLIRLLSENIPKKDLVISSAAMGTTVATGTLIIYALSSIFAAFNKFKLSFYTAGFVVLIVSIIWLFLYNKAVKAAKSEMREEREAEETKESPTSEKKTINKKVFYFMLAALCFYAVGVNLIKDGLTTWVPSILKEEFNMSDSLSILLTLFLPILAVFGNVFSIKVHSKIPDYITHCFVFFSLIALVLVFIIGSIKFEWVVLMVVGLVAANFFASSLNSLLTGIFPLFMRGMVNSGLIAGIINGFCYLGSTISSYGLGSIADNFGWIYVFWTLFGFCVLVFIIWVVYVSYKRFVEKSAS